MFNKRSLTGRKKYPGGGGGGVKSVVVGGLTH